MRDENSKEFEYQSKNKSDHDNTSDTKFQVSCGLVRDLLAGGELNYTCRTSRRSALRSAYQARITTCRSRPLTFREFPNPTSNASSTMMGERSQPQTLLQCWVTATCSFLGLSTLSLPLPLRPVRELTVRAS